MYPMIGKEINMKSITINEAITTIEEYEHLLNVPNSEVKGDTLEDILGHVGEYLDDSENKVMPEYIRKRFENIYKVIYDRFLLNESKL